MQTKKIIMSLIIGIFLISFISALEITSNPIIEVDKVSGQNIDFQVSVKNTEPFKLFNITFEDDFISMNKFDLEPNENKTFTVTIDKDKTFDGQIRLRGDYYTDVGYSNETKTVIVDYDNGFDVCNLELIVGDKVVWVNDVLDDIKLKNYETGNYFATIPENTNYTKVFNYPEEFHYYGTIIGIPFTEVCYLNVKDKEGYVHNSEYDGVIDLKINLIYPLTTITKTILTDEYNIDYGSSKEDILKIENTGNKIAKTIHLHSDWFSFDINDFDLEPGESKNIGYKITPIIYNTNDTDKTYTKTLKIEGNFETLEHDFKITIPYKDIGSLIGNTTIDEDGLRNLIRYLCEVNPDWEECKRNEFIQGGSNDDLYVNLSSSTLYEFMTKSVKSDREQNEILYHLGENTNQSVNSTKAHENKLNNLEDNYSRLLNMFKDLKVALIFIGLIGIFLFSCIVGIIILFKKRLGGKITEYLKNG